MMSSAIQLTSWSTQKSRSTLTGGSSEHQGSGRGPAHVEHVGVGHTEGLQGAGLQEGVEVGQAVRPHAQEQVP